MDATKDMKSREKTGGGFTLLEILVVVGIIAILLGVVGASYHGIGRGARMRGAVQTLRSTVGLARQHAILKGQPLELHFFGDHGGFGYFVTNRLSRIQVHAPVYLPTGIEFVSLPPPIVFCSQGASGPSQPVTIEITEFSGQGVPVSLTVYPLTGLIKE